MATCHAAWYPPARLRTRAVFITRRMKEAYLVSVYGEGPLLGVARDMACAAARECEENARGEYSSDPPPSVTIVTAAEAALLRDLQSVQFYLLPQDARRVILQAAFPAGLAQAVDEVIATGLPAGT